MLSKLLEAMGFNQQKANMRRWREAAARIGQREPEWAGLSNEDFAAKSKDLAQKCSKGKEAALGRRDDLLEEIFAAGREASRRILGMRHFDVQLIGAMALHEGMLAEMKTGEGKSLCLTLAAIYNAALGRQTHVVTVNEYLARRDAVAMAPLYAHFGLSVGLLEDGQGLEERREQYSRDVVYGVNHEFGFDYLRHNMAKTDRERRMVRGLGLAIVDEVDSILIDEARTPLIISGTENDDLSVYGHCWKAALALREGPDLEVDKKARTAVLSEGGFERVEEMFLEWGLIEKGHHLYEARNNAMLRALQACMSARFLFHRDQHYIVRDGKVMIVDENTGRLMPDRRWSNGIHQAVEAKEGVEVLQESKTMATITYQNYFGLYEKLSGLTGTALTQAMEFHSIYGLETMPIPTHKPMARIDQPDVVYRTEKEKYKALAEEAKKAVENGRPVLAGTSNIEESEKLSEELVKLGVEHKLLNAKNHELEAQIIEEAGFPGRVTVATNMAGRGTDIVLGGNWGAIERELVAVSADEQTIAERKARWLADRDAIAAAGGLLVLGCARNESRRVDNQLRGRSGRQGDPGESKFYISLDDNLFRVYAQNGVLAMIDKYNMMPEGSCLEHPMLNKSLDKAQAAVENHHFDMRKQLQDYDGVGATQRKSVYAWRDEIIDADDATSWETAFDVIVQGIDDTCMALSASDYVEAWATPEAKESLGLIAELPEEFDAWVAEADNGGEIKQKLTEYWMKPLKEAREKGLANTDTVKSLMLDRIDDAWQEHLTTLQNLMDGIHLRSYAQKDPKQEYKREGYELFARLRGAIVCQAASALISWSQWRLRADEQSHESSAAPLFDGPESGSGHWLEQAEMAQSAMWSDGIVVDKGILWAMEAKISQVKEAAADEPVEAER